MPCPNGSWGERRARGVAAALAPSAAAAVGDGGVVCSEADKHDWRLLLGGRALAGEDIVTVRV